MRQVLIVTFLAIGITEVVGQSSTEAPPPKSDFLYNGTSSLLSLTRNLPMTISVQEVTSSTNEDSKVLFKAGKTLAKVNFPPASKTTTTGSRTEGTGSATFSLKLESNGKVDGDGLAADELAINLQMIYDLKTQYWNVSSMAITLSGKLTANCTSDCNLEFTNQAMNVAPKGGFTKRAIDVNCQRDYTICAPVSLCWTCYDQKLSSKLDNSTTSKKTLSIVIPGMKLQPLVANKTQSFGYRWDCDPVWSSGLWFSLLLTLFLIVTLAWAIDMLVTLQTPSRFDDPKGKPLVVPLSD